MKMHNSNDTRSVAYDRLITLFGILFLGLLLLAIGCDSRHVPGSAVKVAKVDTEYVYEANVTEFVENYRESQRSRLSNFVGFPPDMILNAREHAIDEEIRKEIKRTPGVSITQQEIRELANNQVEELAWKIHEALTQDGADFGALAQEYSTGDSARVGGQLQPFGVLDNPEPYQQRVYTMEPGEISEPFSAWDGWRIIRLDEIIDDPVSGTLYRISMILLKADTAQAEAGIVDGIAATHTIEILDPKYNARLAFVDGEFEKALEYADLAIERNVDDELAYYLRARALWELDRTDEVLIALEEAAGVGRISDALVPYYHFYRGQFLEELDRTDDALVAYHQSYEVWRQDINLAYALRDTFERLGDDEYLEIIMGEIDIIARQDSAVLTFGSRGASGGIIITDQGTSEGSSAEYEPGYRAGDQ